MICGAGLRAERVGTSSASPEPIGSFAVVAREPATPRGREREARLGAFTAPTSLGYGVEPARASSGRVDRGARPARHVRDRRGERAPSRRRAHRAAPCRALARGRARGRRRARLRSPRRARGAARRGRARRSRRRGEHGRVHRRPAGPGYDSAAIDALLLRGVGQAQPDQRLHGAARVADQGQQGRRDAGARVRRRATSRSSRRSFYCASANLRGGQPRHRPSRPARARRSERASRCR